MMHALLRRSTIAIALLGAPLVTLRAQATPPSTPRPLPPAPPVDTAAARPVNSPFICGNGAYAPAGAGDDYCNARGGILMRFVIRRAPPAPLPRPEGAIAPPPPPPSQVIPKDSIKKP
ncbi:MAG: hypothetical protein K2X99_13490 [Gemmatimonadaceae bacterium]|nr:hypothetical protein [Gemmatimonadaceae bacterium]